MASSEKIISPGVFTNEIDQTFLPAAVGEIGAAVIGPTVKGPPMIPTVVSNMSEFTQVFGEVFMSGSVKRTYLTSELARNYLKHGNKLTVVRILDGEYTPADATVVTEADPTTGTFASMSILFAANPTGSVTGEPHEISVGGIDFTFVSSSAGLENSSTQIFVPFGIGNANADAAGYIDSASQNFKNAINNTDSASLHGLNITALRGAETSTTDTVGLANTADYVSISASSAGTAGNISIDTGSAGVAALDGVAGPFNFVEMDGATAIHDDVHGDGPTTLIGGTDGDVVNSFKLHTHAIGEVMNNSGSGAGVADTEFVPHFTGSNQTLVSGSKDNIRWEISSKNNKKGTFSLLVRRGDDSLKQKQVLETWNNLSLDPNDNNYIGKRIGDSKPVLSSPGSNPYIAISGSFPNKSKYVRVEVVTPIPDYLDENGNVRNNGEISASLPATGSGSFAGSFLNGSSGWIGFDSFGTPYSGGETSVDATASFYDMISDDDTQGYVLQTDNEGKTAYEDAINLLGNADEYDINLLFMPGVIDNFDNHQAVVTKAVNMAEDRGDLFLVLDPSGYGEEPSAATTRAKARNSSYAAMYYPWVRVSSPALGQSVWAPPSVGAAGVYSFNDKVSHPWFAPAGLNRGTIDSGVDTERQLLRGTRDTLYESNVNPIAKFPGQGVCVWGQKTLQKKASALDRVNVRRLLIKLKKFFASTSRFLVFEQNNAKTRNRFLNIVNPYMEQVQANSGVNVFKVVMDETNNTPDTIDRNQLYGQIYIQPTRSAEFIVLDFNIQRTGAAFPE